MRGAPNSGLHLSSIRASVDNFTHASYMKDIIVTITETFMAKNLGLHTHYDYHRAAGGGIITDNDELATMTR